MNKQAKKNSRGIEWCDYSWNPVGGCKHQCRWEMPDGSIAECYAETVAERVSQAAYPHGFEHHYWRPELLKEPFKLRTPSKIFLDSMSDLLGLWVEDWQIREVLAVCAANPQHTFQLLTKNAPRIEKFEFPANVWVGVSAPPTRMFGRQMPFEAQKRMVGRMMTALANAKASIRWMSIEPLSFDIAPLLKDSPLDWAVIGAASNGNRTYQPQPEWVANVLQTLDAQGTRIFFKGNLKWSPWREEFPHARLALPAPKTDVLMLNQPNPVMAMAGK